ncbi:MAG TPA: D-alanyl-D-alanine carboxypeptidase/D-alanyl-D-alanine-endopeptidase [Gaiellaceae bacterium]|nr:D-alanyl-D-alanine carboxypeptidase/D-alanyl-D-alanine-endopeptidase [Gaiellaceae bacterium]
MGRVRELVALVAALAAALGFVQSTAARPDVGAVGARPFVQAGSTAVTRPLLRFDRLALSRRLADALRVPHVPRKTSGALAIDLESGSVVYSLNPDRPLVPASNEKLATSFAALVQLGADYRFRTEVLGTGELDDSTWVGDLYLRGHGDPSLTTHDLKRLAGQLRTAGIRRVTGSVLADESAFDTRRTAPGWKPSFYMDESAPLSALVVNRAIFRGKMTPDPAGAAAALFTAVLGERGIRVDGESGWGTAPERASALAEVESKPLAEILRFMDRESDNFTAEQVLKTLGAEVRGKGTTGAGAAVVAETLGDAGVPLQGVRIADGSGLSRLDRLTPRALAAILVTTWGDAALRPVLWDALPVAGLSGTLERRMDARPARGAVHAKTGTTAIASALSGYVRHRFVFVIVQNGHPISTWWARQAQDRFATALAAQ